MTITRIVGRNILRHKLRFGLGFLAVFLAALLMHLYFGTKSALADFFEGSLVRSTLLVKPRGSMYETQFPNRWADEMRALPGVVAATPMMNAVAPLGTRSDIYFFGIDPEAFRKVAEKDLADVPEEVYRKFASDPSAALLARGVGVQHGLRVGQLIDMEIRGALDQKLYPDYRPPAVTRFTGQIVGEIGRGVFSDRVIIVHRKTMERLLNWDRGWGVLVRYGAGVDAGDLSGRIESEFQNRERGIESLVLDNWFGSLRIFINQLAGVALSIIALVMVLAGVILLHGVSVGALQLLPEVGTLRALGSSRIEVLLLLAGEGLAVTIGGAGVATGLLWALSANTALIDLKKIDPNAAPVFALQWGGVASVMACALAVGLAGAVIPALLLTREPISVLLRRRHG
jgi:ABC-type lipoprotein release transport system permease subunit